MENIEKINTPYLSVVIPCWNEEKNLENGVLDEVYQYLIAQSYTWELVIVNDASSDKSRDLIENFITGKSDCYLYDIPHGGKPAAVWEGIQRSKGEITLFTDMDQSTPIHELAKLLPWYDQGFDVVIGSRGMTREGTSLLRKFGSVVFLTFRQIVLLRNIRDSQCGFKSCRRAVGLEVFPRLQYFRQKQGPVGWKVSAYDVELLFLCDLAGYQIKEVVVEWLNRDISDTKSQQGELTRYLQESLEMAKEIVRVKLNQLRGFYERS